ncbi:hypothetical protein ACQKQC_06430 [Vibrio fortis]|uniref:hypothetical protein n=1 Tax=Vibrio fortis TaxID=212667 RepID=UPI004067C8EB
MKKKHINEFAFGVNKGEVAIIVDEDSIDLKLLAKCSYGIVKNREGLLFIALKTPPNNVEYVIGSITTEQAKTIITGVVYVGAYTGLSFEGERIPQAE